MATTLISITVNLIVLFVFFLYFRRRISSVLQTTNIVQQIQREVDEMIVELNQTADRNIGLMEERLERLSALISDADKRIGVLKRESDRSKVSETVYTQLRPKITPPPPPAEPRKSARDEVLELYRQGVEPKEIAARVNKTLGEVDLIISLRGNRK